MSVLLLACDPEYVVGKWDCGSPEASDEPGMPNPGTVDSPWHTSFEHGFCDYVRARGFCYASPEASYEIVDSPVKSGRSAAAFSVTSAGRGGLQSRCVREGVLPREASYGAWFLIPELAENRGTWNLMHFQGGDPPDLHYLWDVSIGTAEDGHLFAYLFDYVNGDVVHSPPAETPIPIGRYFQLEVRWLRSSEDSGVFALYQNNELLIEVAQRVTDDTEWGQWYVGNWADGLTPPDSVVYVDDVTIRSER